jgi:hypothetical protein
MTIDEFINEITALDGIKWVLQRGVFCYLTSKPVVVRTKNGCLCPVAFLATYKIGNYHADDGELLKASDIFDNGSYMKAAAALDISPDDVSLIMRAADNDFALPELRQRLLKACRLEERV